MAGVARVRVRVLVLVGVESRRVVGEVAVTWCATLPLGCSDGSWLCADMALASRGSGDQIDARQERGQGEGGTGRRVASSPLSRRARARRATNDTSCAYARCGTAMVTAGDNLQNLWCACRTRPRPSARRHRRRWVSWCGPWRGVGGRVVGEGVGEGEGERVWRSSGGWCWRWKRNGAHFWRLGGLLLLVTARPPAERPKDALLRGLFTTERAQGRRAHRLLQPLRSLCSTKGSLNRRRGSLR